MKRALLFSGQGSQYVGMGRELSDRYATARDLFNRADEILGYKLSDICFNGPDEKLKETRFTQPALFVYEAALLEVVRSELDFHAVAGHSVGEFAALYAAGVIAFEDAVRIVAERGGLMFQSGELRPGTMAAIIGLDDEKVEEICHSITTGTIVPANFNSPGQVVISGDRDCVLESLAMFKEAGARMVTQLAVSGAFHSPLMSDAHSELCEIIKSTNFSDASVDVYPNVTACATRNADALKATLMEQVISPVRWTQSLRAMQADGITDYTEIGPKNVLQGLVKRTLSAVTIAGVDTVESIEKVSSNKSLN